MTSRNGVRRSDYPPTAVEQSRTAFAVSKRTKESTDKSTHSNAGVDQVAESKIADQVHEKSTTDDKNTAELVDDAVIFTGTARRRSDAFYECP